MRQVLAVPATTTIRGIPTEVELGVADGLPRACALTLDSVVPIRPELCTERIAVLEPAAMERVCTALAVAVDC